MALQTSIVNYFNSRKRKGDDDASPPAEKSTVAPAKVVVLDEVLSPAGGVSERGIIYTSSPKFNLGKKTTPASVPKLPRKTPKTASSRNKRCRSTGSEKGTPSGRQIDIRKSLLPSFQEALEQEGPKNDELKGVQQEETVNVPFEVRGLPSPKKGCSPFKKAQSLLNQKEDGIKKNLIAENPEEQAFTDKPKKLGDLKKELGLSSIKSKLIKSSRLSQLKENLKKVSEGYSKLKEIDERKAAIEKSPKLKSFSTISIDVPASPSKKFMDEVKIIPTLPSLLSASSFKSPIKAQGQLPYVSPRKILESHMTKIGSPSKLPSYQKYCNLASPGKQALGLPYKYRCLAETFRSVDTVFSIMFNRSETVLFEKLKKAVQQMSKRNLTEQVMGQMLRVMPNCYSFSYEKIRLIGSQVEKYELVLKPSQSGDEDLTKQNEMTVLNPSVMLQRRRDFYTALLEITKDHHDVFLKSLDPPLVIPRNRLTRWHPEFEVDSCPDIIPIALPEAPGQTKCCSAKEVLSRSRDLFGSNLRMEKALQKLSEQGEKPIGITPAAQAIPALAKALKGIPKSLLEKIRAKQAAKAVEMLTRMPEVEKRRHELSRLPEMARIINNLFVLERKSVMAKSHVMEKIKGSHRESLSIGDIEKHLNVLAECLPDWVTIYTLNCKEYIKIKKEQDLSQVLLTLENLNC